MTAIKSETLHAAHGLTGTFDGATQMALALLNRTFNSLAPLIATLVLTLASASSKAQDTEVCTRLQTQLAAYDERHPAVSPKLLRYTRAVEQHTAQIEQVRADIDARARAREAKDWATADAIRDRLAAAGIVIEDSADGVRWSLASDE